LLWDTGGVCGGGGTSWNTGVVAYWNVGVLEHWNNGRIKMIKAKIQRQNEAWKDGVAWLSSAKLEYWNQNFFLTDTR